jgi:hypothetical protein
MRENQDPAPEPAEPDQPAQPGPLPAAARSPRPAMPVIRPGEMHDGPHPLVDGVSPTIGWQKQPEARGGRAFAIIARTDLGSLRVAERFPLTEDGWAQAWEALLAVNPDAADKVRAVLTARASAVPAQTCQPGAGLPTGPSGRTRGMAVASLVLGIAGLCLPIGAVGLLMGHSVL